MFQENFPYLVDMDYIVKGKGWTLSTDGAYLVSPHGTVIDIDFFSTQAMSNFVVVCPSSLFSPAWHFKEQRTGRVTPSFGERTIERILSDISPTYRNYMGRAGSCRYALEHIDVSVTVEKPTAKQCSCGMFDLMNYGCRCGAIEAERKRSNT